MRSARPRAIRRRGAGERTGVAGEGRCARFPRSGEAFSTARVWAREGLTRHDGRVRYIRRYVQVMWLPRTWLELGYLLLGLPLASLLGSYAVTMYATGIALVIIWVGIPILAFAHWSMRPFGSIERVLANRMIDAEIDAPAGRGYRVHAPGRRPTLHDWKEWGHALLHDAQAWRALAWLMMRLVLGPVGFAFALCAIVVPLSLAGAWLVALGYAVGVVPGPGPGEETAQRIVDVSVVWVLVGTPVIVAAIPMFAWVSHHFACLNAALARWALGPSDAERVRAATQRAEMAETQVRIDQELHDSIGHMITMNIIQAGAGAHVFDSDPEFARQALRNIEERGRVAMGELDRIIAAIRGDDAEPRAPLPSLDDLPHLVEQARAAGLTVDSTLAAESAPPALGRAAYAVVREGLTNAAKHAPGARIHVHTAALADALAVSVVNSAGEPGVVPVPAVRGAAPGRRHGLAGIRDRATLLGGASVTGTTGDGGFEVLMLLPLELTLGQADASEDAPCCPWSRVRATVMP